MSKCKETGILYLTYKEGKGMLCGLCGMANTLQTSNSSKVWNSKGSTWFRTEAVREYFNKTMHSGAPSIEKIICGAHFVRNEKKEENLASLCIENLSSLCSDVRFFYWFCKEEVARY